MGHVICVDLIGKHGRAYEPTPEPSTRGVVDIR
jgi:hypothetical protein